MTDSARVKAECMRGLLLIACVFPVALLLSCSLLSRVDQTNLESVVAFYYGTNSGKTPPASQTYPLLSEKSRSQIGLVEWARVLSKRPESVTVLRKEEQQGATYGLVSASFKDGC